MTQEEGARLVLVLAAAYPRACIDAATSEIYETMLADLTYEAASAAVGRLVRKSTFLPSIAEIREEAATLELGDVKPGAEAWGEVLRAIRKVGSYGNPHFADEITAACVRMLGWRNLCLEGHNDAADRARFIELYNELAKRERTEVVAGAKALLPGPVRNLLPGVGRTLAEPRRTSPEGARKALDEWGQPIVVQRGGSYRESDASWLEPEKGDRSS